MAEPAKIPKAIYLETELDLALSLLIGNRALQAFDFYTLCPIQVVATKGSIIIRPISKQLTSDRLCEDEPQSAHINKLHINS